IFPVLLCLSVGLAITASQCFGQSQKPAVQAPYAYLFPAHLTGVVEQLQTQEIEVHELREDMDLDVLVYPARTRAGHDVNEAEGKIHLNKTPRTQRRWITAGTIMVKTNQKQKAKILELFNAAGKDNLLGDPEVQTTLQRDHQSPFVTLVQEIAITHGKVRPLAKDRKTDQPITFETVYGPKNRASFSGSPVSGLTWLSDGEHFLQSKQGRLYRVHAATGQMTPFFDPDALSTGLSRLTEFDDKTAGALARRTRFQMNPDRTAVLINHQNDLYTCCLDGSDATRLTHSDAPEKYATFSPSGHAIAFVREGNLYVVEVDTQKERRLTQDGGGLILNGEADWVYYEEVLNRAAPAMFWWSPDSESLAFMRFDDQRMTEYTVVNNVTNNQTVEKATYPKSGDQNPDITLGIVSATGGDVRWVELEDYLPGSYIMTRVGWFPDSSRVYFYIQDRIQTWLDVVTASRAGRSVKSLLRETSPAWVTIPETPVFLKDSSFLFFSERSGWKHLYWYDRSGKLKRQLTHGDWEARRLHHVDEPGKTVYVTGTRDSSLAEQLYQVSMDSNDIERLTHETGQHSVKLSPTGTYFIDTWSNHTTPTQVVLRDMQGEPVRTLDTNPVYRDEEYRFGTYEQFQIETQDGFLIEASLLKPADFDASRSYPVWFMTYAGPHAPSIRDTWSGGRTRDQMLAEMGILVFRCDPRSASGKGACSAWTAYRQLGVQELKDISEAIEWLKAKPFVDPDRIGMSGHSYGGFMTSYAMTHSTLFCAGIAGAPVTDWRLYDSIYTERYMDLPQNNPEGYKKTSVVEAAKDLHGRLLLIHGAIDDNVHIENTYKLVRALQTADKEFQLMIYPPNRHGIGGMHYNRLTVDFIKQSLGLN
ncbi:MAG: S9 family peptidase, partial [Phycisphaeraceae bacterium]|nr:S9 family peptidase [Phycisphaeraceae bacterium]